MAEHDEHRIAPGVRGWLDSPPSSAIASDCLMVSGWAFASGSPIVNVRATGLGAPRALQYGLRRDDVARVYPDEPNATRSGFTGYLELEGQPSTRVDLLLTATLSDGRSIMLFERPLTRMTAEDEPSPIRLAVRHVIRRPGVLLSAQSWRSAWTQFAQALGRPHTPVPTLNETTASAVAREALAQSSRAFLASFLAAGSGLRLATSPQPVVSVVVVVWNRADLTLTCLRSLALHTEVPSEVIVVDNASTDETRELLDRLGGVTVVRNSGNLGFTVAANIGAKAARGELLLFLNNDAELVPGSIGHLVDTARRTSAIGAVGGKLVFPDGRLQEAGSIIWSDGSCDAYGRGGDPAAPEFNFERQVDFCSGALLLTPRAVFEGLGGFDERYQPAYYEDADYCVRLWEGGLRVVYQPKAVAIHHEFGSAASSQASIDLQRERRPIFASKHVPWLRSQSSRASANLVAVRSHPHRQTSVVVVDDAVPDARMGAGFPRAAALVRALAELGYLITIYVTADADRLPAPRGDFPAVEVVQGGSAGLRAFFQSRHFDLAIVSRPHNMQYVKAAVGSDLSAFGVPCVYDAEAIYALREIGRRRLAGQPMLEADSQAMIDTEAALTRGCAAVLAVSDTERKLLAAAGVPHVFVLGHAVQIEPTTTAFDRRHSILFVGAFGPESPNEDAVRYFLGDVLPALRSAGRCGAPIVVAGARIPELLTASADATVSWRSDVDDLMPLYDDARVFIAPTRYGAGISLKVIEAAARGIPVVCSTLVADQLGWRSGTELMAADGAADFARAVAAVYADSELWRRIRAGALRRVARDHGGPVFRAALQAALDAVRLSRIGA